MKTIADVIYLVYENADSCEGRGPMIIVKDSGFFTSKEEAQRFADTIPGVMGVKPKGGSWKNETYPHVEVRAIKRHNGDYMKQKQELLARINVLQADLRRLEMEHE